MRYYLICLILSICNISNCFADTVILKNKHSINGVIVKEDESYVVLNVGCGTVTLSRADIEFIEKSDEVTNTLLMQNWREQYFESFPAPTSEAQELLEDFKKVREKKEQLIKNITRKDNIAKKISMLQSDISQLQDERGDIGEKIKSMDAEKDIVEYNALVVEFNSLNSKLRKAVNALQELQEDYETINKETAGYINQFADFKSMFEKRYQDISTGITDPQQKDFYKNLGEKLDILEGDIKHQEIEFAKQGENIIVTATLNDKMDIRMLVDTGASLTVVTEEVAMELGIDPNSLKQNIELILTDGRHIPAKFILLDLVKIGTTEAKNVEAAVIKDKPSREIDGLLGMSFLKNFSFSINAEKQRLILDSFQE